MSGLERSKSTNLFVSARHTGIKLHGNLGMLTCGIGVFKGERYISRIADEKVIKEDALVIYDYLTTVVGLQEENIILFGRSMGSGPSSYLAAVRKTFSLVLMSAYTSI
jgi:hypothetical protein